LVVPRRLLRDSEDDRVRSAANEGFLAERNVPICTFVAPIGTKWSAVTCKVLNFGPARALLDRIACRTAAAASEIE
jgi:hypothetical protein